MDKIENLREEIDVINKDIIKLLISRFEISKKIGEEKKLIKKSVLDKNREDEIYINLEKQLKNSEYKVEIIEIFKEVITRSKEIQKRGK